MNIGIWIDQREAFIISANERKVLHHVESDVEDTNLGGGYGGATKYHQQDASSQSKLTNRKNQQLQDYFEKVIKLLSGVNGLYIFGPGELKKLFKKEVENNPELKDVIRVVASADSMTENQLCAQVHDFFEEGEG